jgi:uncharacterized DUF497 family protein
MGHPHPSRAEAFEWNEGNESELAAHHIRPEEVYEVWANGPAFAPNVKRRAGDWKLVGFTNGGRSLTIVIRYDDEARIIRAITGWSSTQGEQSRYLKGSR